MTVCSNNFIDVKLTMCKPNPTLYPTRVTISINLPSKDGKSVSSSKRWKAKTETLQKNIQNCIEGKETEQALAVPSFQFCQLSHESDVCLHTGLSGTKMFALIFSILNTKAEWMQYWKGTKQTLPESSRSCDIVFDIYNRKVYQRIVGLDLCSGLSRFLILFVA